MSRPHVSDDWSKYSWLDDDRSGDVDAGCLGVVIGTDEATVRRLLEVDESTHRLATVEEAWRLSDSDFGNDVVQVARLGDAVVTFEVNGWHGVEMELALPLSRAGRYVAYFWNVNAVRQFIFAQGGSLERDFDPLLYDNVGGRDHALPEERDLPFPTGHVPPLTPGRASLALVERLTGIEITRQWLLDEPHPTYRVDPEPRSA